MHRRAPAARAVRRRPRSHCRPDDPRVRRPTACSPAAAARQEQFAVGGHATVDHPHGTLEQRHVVGRSRIRRLREESAPSRALARIGIADPHDLREQRMVERQDPFVPHGGSVTTKPRRCKMRDRLRSSGAVDDLVAAARRRRRGATRRLALVVVQAGQPQLDELPQAGADAHRRRATARRRERPRGFPPGAPRRRSRAGRAGCHRSLPQATGAWPVDLTVETARRSVATSPGPSGCTSIRSATPSRHNAVTASSTGSPERIATSSRTTPVGSRDGATVPPTADRRDARRRPPR